MTQLSIHLTESISTGGANDRKKYHKLRAVRGKKETDNNIVKFEGEER
jgi:hypothetical protein